MQIDWSIFAQMVEDESFLPDFETFEPFLAVVRFENSVFTFEKNAENPLAVYSFQDDKQTLVEFEAEINEELLLGVSDSSTSKSSFFFLKIEVVNPPRPVKPEKAVQNRANFTTIRRLMPLKALKAQKEILEIESNEEETSKEKSSGFFGEREVGISVLTKRAWPFSLNEPESSEVEVEESARSSKEPRFRITLEILVKKK